MKRNDETRTLSLTLGYHLQDSISKTNSNSTRAADKSGIGGWAISSIVRWAERFASNDSNV